MALKHNRHLALAGMVSLPLAAAPLERWLGGNPSTARSAARIAWAFGVLPWLLGAALWCVTARTRSESDWIEASLQDDAVRAYVHALPNGARVFVELPFTGYVIDLGAPRVSVFFDARNDCYPGAVLRTAMDINDGIASSAEAARALSAHGTTHAIVRCSSKAMRSLAQMRRASERNGVCLLESAHEAL
jgi:hypothetical protein